MDDFTQGYLEASVCFPSEKIGQGKGFNISDISPATRLQMEADCQRFQQENADLLMKFRKELGWDDPKVEDLMFGGDFWVARNYQSLPYWASGGESRTVHYSAWPRLWSGEFHKTLAWKVENHPESIGYALIEAAHRYGEFPLHLGKDNKIYWPDSLPVGSEKTTKHSPQVTSSRTGGDSGARITVLKTELATTLGVLGHVLVVLSFATLMLFFLWAISRPFVETPFPDGSGSLPSKASVWWDCPGFFDAPMGFKACPALKELEAAKAELERIAAEKETSKHPEVTPGGR